MPSPPSGATDGLEASSRSTPTPIVPPCGATERAPRRAHLGRLAAPLLFAVLVLAFVGRAALTGRALLPIDDLFLYPPWQAHAAEYGVQRPHNPLIADAILQNYSWKRFAADSYAAGQIPLWNPYVLGGQPFLASGQNGSLYPFGVMFYVLPLDQAYAWFIALHLWIAALGAYGLARALDATRLGGIVAGVTFAFCGYLTVSFLWPMVVSTAVWLPALLATIERLIGNRMSSSREVSPSHEPSPRQVSPRHEPSPQPSPSGRGIKVPLPEGEGWGEGYSPAATSVGRPGATAALIAAGATITGLQLLAGHLEMSLYLLLAAGLYTALRLLPLLAGRIRPAVGAGLAALAMVGLGTALAGVQLVPFAEVIGANVRTGWSDYAETIGYALPRERLIGLLVPDYFGNPSHHTYLDLLDGQIRSVEHVRPNREPRFDTEWGGKNYVEGTAYLGILPLMLTVVALAARPAAGTVALGTLALLSLLFAFGTPLYALLYYGIPGVNQLHTPFRWIYPLSLCVAVLAGLGASAFSPTGSAPSSRGSPPLPGHVRGDEDAARRAMRIGLVAALFGGLLIVVLLALLPFRDTATGLAGRLLARSPDLRAGFGEARVLFSYEYANVMGTALLLAASGLAVWLAARRQSLWSGITVLLILIGDLFSFGVGFNTAADTGPLELVPPPIRAIQADPSLFRIVTYGEDDTLPANTNMLFGLQDLRGYDTVILRDYVDYLELIEPQRGIAYSKVAKLFDQRSLASPLLDLLNVKYVLTTKTVTQPGLTLIEASDGVRVYRNERAMPRAFVVGGARSAGDRATALSLVGDPAFDPRQSAVLEGWDSTARPAAGRAEVAEVVEYGGNRVVVRAEAGNEGGVLVLGDVFFDGWTATVDGAATPIFRANALFRAVILPPGAHQVVFAYRPLSFRLGALVSLVATVALLLLSGFAVWQRFERSRPPATASQRVLRNSTFPMMTGLVNRAVDVLFAVYTFRVLQAEGVGGYTFAGVLTGYFDILVGFGLGTLITREVARDHAAAARYLGNTLALRLLLWLLSAGVVALLVGPGAGPLEISPPIALTIWLLLLAILPSIVSGALSAIFMAHERMELPAVVTVVTTILKVSLGLVALIGGWGYVGLATVAVLTNVLTAAMLLGLCLTTIGWPGLRFDRRFARSMAAISLPLMLNNLLNTVFFRIDALLLKPLAGDLALGWYSTAYKFIDGLQIIPSSFVLALFPLLSRHAEKDRAELGRVCAGGLKALLILALPISVGTTLLAEPIIAVFAGPRYLPQSAWALQILIWFLPLSFVNGLTQYVLIALGRQRWITISFLIGAGFNLIANLALIPSYGYLAASAVTVASELVLLIPFWWVIRRELPAIDLLDLAWRPALAALAMAGSVWLVSGWSPLLAIPVGALVYGGVLLALGTLNTDDRAVLHSLISR